MQLSFSFQTLLSAAWLALELGLAGTFTPSLVYPFIRHAHFTALVLSFLGFILSFFQFLHFRFLVCVSLSFQTSSSMKAEHMCILFIPVSLVPGLALVLKKCWLNVECIIGSYIKKLRLI